ncbi:MAG: hypothetical protein LBT16_02315 [Treponema sp.]|jgi:hypothetical protein|nr:hypothetical protein [Treponema sp.]
MQQPGFASKIEEQRPNIRTLLYGIIDDTVQISLNNLDEEQLRHIREIRIKAESLLAILSAETAPAEESLPKPLAGEEQDPFFKELSGIRGLDVKKGFSNEGNDKEKYLKLLRRFCEHFDEWRVTVLGDLKKNLWKEYAIRFETFVKIFNSIGNKDLAAQSGELLDACRKGNSSFCLQKTVSACDAMEAFRQALLGASIFKDDTKSKQVTAENEQFVAKPKDEEAEELKERVSALIEKLQELKEACTGFKANKINEVAQYVRRISINENVDALSAIIVQLVDDLDYDTAAVRIGMLLSVLETYHKG